MVQESDSQAQPQETLIVGLGNPDSEYADTRHNLGFACVRALAERLGVDVKRKRWRSLVGRVESRGLWLVLPQTYMNLSGHAVAAGPPGTRPPPTPGRVGHHELDLPMCR